MEDNYYQRHKERLQQEACERYQNLSEKEKDKRQKKTQERYQNFTELDFEMFQKWHRGVVAITTAQLHSMKYELRFCTGSNPACGVSEICDGENL